MPCCAIKFQVGLEQRSPMHNVNGILRGPSDANEFCEFPGLFEEVLMS